MSVMNCLSVNDKGHLVIGGADTTALASKYGTPMYIMDEPTIRSNCRAFTQSLKDQYDNNGLVLYASKAYCTVDMCRIADSEGLGLDVVSGGELYTAIKSGIDLKKVYFHGNNKTDAELRLALEFGVGCIVVDNAYELDRLAAFAKEYGIVADIMFRIKPGVEAHTHEFIMTGQIDSKFGVALENGEAYTLMKRASELKYINVKGIECHIGSQIFDTEPFMHAAKIMLSFLQDVRKEFGIELTTLNLGGGYGIKYIEEHKPPQREDFIKRIADTVKEACRQTGMPLPYLLIEPGRSIVGDAGITLYTIGSVKEIKGIRKYVSVDGGMGDNPRYALYGASYDFVVANKANAPKNDVVTVAGRYCESGDLLQEGILLQDAKEGDLLAVLCTGAYNYSMASNYNRVPRLPVIMISNGADRVAVKRESYEDIIKNDIL